MNRFRLLTAAVLLCLLGFAPRLEAQGFTSRPEAPKKPDKGEYNWAEPKDWTPPTLEELKTWEWKDGRVKTLRQLAAERAAATPPQLTEQQALEIRNDGKAANDKILSILGRPPSSIGDVDWNATVSRSLDGAPGTLNYLLATSIYEEQIFLLVYPILFSYDEHMRPFADRAFVREWKSNPMADMVTLREDLVWEDGTPVTAYDVEFSFHAARDDRINTASRPEALRWVKAYDPRTVVYFHKQALATNAFGLMLGVLPRHVYSPGLAEDPTMRKSDWNVYWNHHPLSGGPYRVREHQSGQSVLLERRESWFTDASGMLTRDMPYVKLVRFRILAEVNAELLSFEKGEIDDLHMTSRQWMTQTDSPDFHARSVKLRGQSWSYRFIGWNQKPVPDAPFFKDRRVRLAMTYAFDHKEYLEKLAPGLDAAAGIFRPGSWMANLELKPFEQDLDRAEQLLDEAGWKDTDADGVRDKTIDGKQWPFKFTLLCPAGSDADAVAVLLKENLESIGVKIEIKFLEAATFLQATSEHRFEAAVSGWAPGPDPDQEKYQWKTEMYRDGYNMAAYSNPEVDRLFDSGARERNLEKRKIIYQAIDKLIWEDQPYTFMAYGNSFRAFNRRLRGYAFSPRGPYNYSPGFLSIWVKKTS